MCPKAALSESAQRKHPGSLKEKKTANSRSLPAKVGEQCGTQRKEGRLAMGDHLGRSWPHSRLELSVLLVLACNPTQGSEERWQL